MEFLTMPWLMSKVRKGDFQNFPHFSLSHLLTFRLKGQSGFEAPKIAAFLNLCSSVSICGSKPGQELLFIPAD
jgi:hypothetical protein